MPKPTKEELQRARQTAALAKARATRAVEKARDVLGAARNTMQVTLNRRTLRELELRKKKR